MQSPGGAADCWKGEFGDPKRYPNWPNIAALAVWLASVGTLLWSAQCGAGRPEHRFVAGPLAALHPRQPLVPWRVAGSRSQTADAAPPHPTSKPKSARRRGRRSGMWAWGWSCQWSMRQPGNACCSFFRPAAVTLGPVTSSHWSCLSPLRFSNPASVILESPRLNCRSWVKPWRCAIPASVTWLPRNTNSSSWLSPWKFSRAASVNSISGNHNFRSWVNPVKYFNPTSVTGVPSRFTSSSPHSPLRM